MPAVDSYLAIADSKPTPKWAWVLNFGIDMNIELEEVVVRNVSDDALELAAGGAGGGGNALPLGGWGNALATTQVCTSTMD